MKNKIAAILTCLITLPVLSQAAAAQKYYDDFSGTTGLDRKRWWHKKLNTITQAGGVLQMRVPAGKSGDDLESTFGFKGNFDLQVDFKNLSGTGGIWIGVYDNSTPGDFTIGTDVTASGQLIQSGPIRKSDSITSGSFRLTRSGTTSSQTLTASYRKSNSTSWTVLRTLKRNYGPVVWLWIEINGGPKRFQVDVDAVRSEGPTLTYPALPKQAPFGYGNGCYDLNARTWGIPVLGERNFGFVVTDAQSNKQAIFAVGLRSTRISLTALGTPACSLYTSLDVVMGAGMTDKEGEAAIKTGVPNVTALRGLRLFSQFAVADSNSPSGIAFTNGVELTIL